MHAIDRFGFFESVVRQLDNTQQGFRQGHWSCIATVSPFPSCATPTHALNSVPSQHTIVRFSFFESDAWQLDSTQQGFRQGHRSCVATVSPFPY